MTSWSFDDTIVAVATGRGPSALAVVRVSGSAARAVLIAVAPALRPSLVPRKATLATITHPLSLDNADRALVTWYPSPHSYTGEDTVEISTHGGTLAPRLAMEALIAAGARVALPGEFTRRALLNGKLDLLEAEAVLDLIEGSSPALHRSAIHQLEGGLSSRVIDIRRRLVELSALIAYGIDFPDEDEPPVPPKRILATAEEALERLDALLSTAPHGELLREGALVVLAGRPNSGKSSLFNALCGRERALVADVPGTTRDAIEAPITVEGFPFRLVDTAGLRSTDDAIESLGIEVAQRYVEGADVVLICGELGRDLDEAETVFLERHSGKSILIRTKSDLVPGSGHEAASQISVSVRTGEGLEALRQQLYARTFGVASIAADEPIVTRDRHVRALRAAGAELRTFIELLQDDGPAEFASVHLAGAIELCEELVGRVDQEDVLDAVFGQFCVGK